jgi:LmbE family N-acetylglucosaminyl deacetylase
VRSRIWAIVFVFVLALAAALVAPAAVFASPLGTVVFYAPHPDDESISMAITIQREIAIGRKVVVVLLTDGDGSGVFDDWTLGRIPGATASDLNGDGVIDRSDFALARRNEFKSAMGQLGVTDVEFWGAADAHLQPRSDGSVGNFRDAGVDTVPWQQAMTASNVAAVMRIYQARFAPNGPVLHCSTMKAAGDASGDYLDHPHHRACADALMSLASNEGFLARLFKVYVYYLYHGDRWAQHILQGTPEQIAAKDRALAGYAIGQYSSPIGRGDDREFESFDNAPAFDEVAVPSTTASLTGTTGNAGWYRSAVNVSLSATVTAGDVALTQYNVDGAGWQTYSGPFAIAGDGTHALRYRSTARDGHVEAEKTADLAIDTAGPVISLGAPSQDATYVFNAKARTSWSASDAGSGLAIATATVDAGQLFDTSALGAKSFSIAAVDAAGNRTVKVFQYRIVYGMACTSEYPTNAQCLDCHDRRGALRDSRYVLESDIATFTVDRVDMSTACEKCHWVGGASAVTASMPYRTNSHSYSSVAACNGSGCHTSPFAALNGMAVPHSLVTSMGSYFYSNTSYKVDAATLHRIHANPRWPASLDMTVGASIPGQNSRRALHELRCPTCHSAVACSACHGEGHGAHGSAAAGGTFAEGGTIGDAGAYSVAATISCTAANCHPYGAISLGTTYGRSDAGLTLTGTWTTLSGSQFMDGSAMKSNGNGSSVHISLSNVAAGTEFSCYGLALPTGGSAYVQVDGSTVATVSCYAPAQSGTTELYRGVLPAGDHTLSLVNAQLPGRSGGRFIAFDTFVVYPTGYVTQNGFFRPSCKGAGCHTD